MDQNFSQVCMAAPQAPGQPRRALILPGGGLRLSYQVGILLALEQAGLGFQIMDGTSGGSLNLSMLLSGVPPQDMARRWRSLRLQDTVSFLPLKDYLQGGSLEALADGRGFRDKVLPHLGISIDRIRAATGVQASYNLLDYGAKAVEVIPSTAIDADLLIAGMSLPGVFPPLHRDGKTYLDTGFVQDANLTEAVRQGAEELWLLWGLGNTGVYRGDPLHLYVQMLEMSANASLNQQLAAIADLNQRIARGDSPFGQTRAITVHVVRPDHALPLDPDLYAGRIDHATLIDMGHADGWRYLSQAGLVAGGRPVGLAPVAPNPTRMHDPVPGVRLQFEFAGALAMAPGAVPQPARLTLCVHLHALDAFIAAPEPQAPLTGRLQLSPAGAAAADPQPVHSGRYTQTTLPDGAREIAYRMQLPHGDRTLTLAATQTWRDDPGFDLWQDLATLSVQLSDGDQTWAGGDLRLALPDLKRWLATVQATETRSLAEATRTVGRYAKFLLRELTDVYGWTG
jgi:predicted acylesterase/phospholipase RssA